MTLHASIPHAILICALSLPAPVGAQQLSDEFVSAAREGNVAKVERLLDAGAGVSARDDDGLTPLHWAVKGGAIDEGDAPEVTKVLIDHGADVNARDDHGWTPLFYAYDVPEIAEVLVDHGADVNARNDRGATPLHQVAFKGVKRYRNQRIPSQKKVAKLLLRNGADVNARDNNGRDPVELARHMGSSSGLNDTEIRATIVQAINQIKRRECNSLKELLQKVIELRIEQAATKQQVLGTLIGPDDTENYQFDVVKVMVNFVYERKTRAELRNNPQETSNAFYRLCMESDT